MFLVKLLASLVFKFAVSRSLENHVGKENTVSHSHSFSHRRNQVFINERILKFKSHLTSTVPSGFACKTVPLKNLDLPWKQNSPLSPT